MATTCAFLLRARSNHGFFYRLPVLLYSHGLSRGATCTSQSIIQTLSLAYVCKFHVSAVAKLLCTEQKTRRGEAPRGKVCSLVGLKILFCLDQWREVSPQGEETGLAEPFQIWSTSWSQVKYTSMSYILPHFYSTMDGQHLGFLILCFLRPISRRGPRLSARLSSLKMLFY